MSDKARGRPLGSYSTTYIKIEDLLKILSPSDCIPVGSQFLKKYNILSEKSKQITQDSPDIKPELVNPPEQKVQIEITEF